MDAQRKLVAWLGLKGWSQVDLSKELGVSQANVSRWISGEQRPRLLTMHRIAEITGGMVSAGDWVAVLPRSTGSAREIA